MSIENPLLIVATITVVGLIFSLGAWVGAISNDRRSFKMFMAEVRTDIKKILARMPAVKVLDSESRIGLSETGKEIAEKLDAEEWAARHSEIVRELVKGKEPYEIQEECLEYARKYKPEGEMKKAMMTEAFENGVTQEDVSKVLGIALRDSLLEEKKEEED